MTVQSTYTYDNNGNLIRKTHKITNVATTYTYDYENRLTKINLPLGITAEYKYDPFGRRIEKNISSQITTKYIYDNEDIIMEYTTIIPTNTNITTKYIHGPNIDEPLAMIRNNKTYYYHADALGSITRMTDQNGSTVQTIRYDTFGNIKYISNPLLIQPYAYTGREFDIESGLYYLRNRYYDPKTGRFISKDPIGFNGGDVNLFRYVGNGPVNLIDPFGLQQRTPRIGPPNSQQWIPDEKGGGGKNRIFGPDGRAIKDIDYGHNHGAGDPHVHDWNGPMRQPGRQPLPREIPEPTSSPQIPWWQRIPLRWPGPFPIIIDPCLIDSTLPGCTYCPGGA